MIIFICGLPGTGKTTLAKILSEYFGIFKYEIDEVKKKVFLSDPNYEYNLKNGIPFPDEIRIKVFKKVIRDLKNLSKKYKHIIVEDTMHNKFFRGILFNGSKKYYKKYILILIKADDRIVKKRLREKPREGHIILGNPVKMYIAYKKISDKVENADIILENNSTLNIAKKRLIDSLKKYNFFMD